MFLEGCANSASPMDSLYALGTRANPLFSNSATGGESKLYLNIIEGLMKQGRHSAALAFLDGYSQSGEELSSRYWLLRGNALLALGRDGDATGAFSKLQDTSLMAQGWNGMGRIAAAEHDWAEAEKDFGKAVDGDPANPDFLNNLAFTDLNLHKVDNAVTRLQQAHELDPGADRIRTNLIIALTLKGDSARADLFIAGIKDGDRREAVQALVKGAVATLTTERKS
jgi:Flp pilus assembly protein TadD